MSANSLVFLRSLILNRVEKGDLSYSDMVTHVQNAFADAHSFQEGQNGIGEKYSFYPTAMLSDALESLSTGLPVNHESKATEVSAFLFRHMVDFTGYAITKVGADFKVKRLCAGIDFTAFAPPEELTEEVREYTRLRQEHAEIDLVRDQLDNVYAAGKKKLKVAYWNGLVSSADSALAFEKQIKSDGGIAATALEQQKMEDDAEYAKERLALQARRTAREAREAQPSPLEQEIPESAPEPECTPALDQGSPESVDTENLRTVADTVSDPNTEERGFNDDLGATQQYETYSLF